MRQIDVCSDASLVQAHCQTWILMLQKQCQDPGTVVLQQPRRQSDMLRVLSKYQAWQYTPSAALLSRSAPQSSAPSQQLLWLASPSQAAPQTMLSTADQGQQVCSLSQARHIVICKCEIEIAAQPHWQSTVKTL